MSSANVSIFVSFDIYVSFVLAFFGRVDLRHRKDVAYLKS